MKRAVITLFFAVLGTLAVLASPGHAVPVARAEVYHPRNFVLGQSCGHVVFGIPAFQETLGSFGRPEVVWIDLSLFNNNFTPGTFVNSGPYVPQEFRRSDVQWDGILPQRTHYYRLNALIGGKWVELGRASFESLNCGDFLSFTCDPITITNTVEMVSADRAASGGPSSSSPDKWVDISLSNNGFLPGTFFGMRMTDSHTIWRGIVPGQRHYYRHHWFYPGQGWFTQTPQGASFLPLDCRDLPRESF